MYVPQVHASHGGQANANMTTHQQTTSSKDGGRTSFWANPKVLGIGTAALVLIGLITLYPVLSAWK